MIRLLATKVIARQERALRVPFIYLREIALTSMPSFIKLALTRPMSTHRNHLPREAFHIARLGATMVEDCGECVQLVLNVAQQERMPSQLLNAALLGHFEFMPPTLFDVFCFAQSVARGKDDPTLRDRLRDIYGREAFVELSLAIASARVLPTVKRAMGYTPDGSATLPTALEAEPRRRKRRFRIALCVPKGF